MQYKSTSFYRLIILFFLFFSCNSNKKNELPNQNTRTQQIEQLKAAKNPSVYNALRDTILSYPNDSLKNTLISDISYHFYSKNDSIKFRYWNSYSFKISEERENISGIAEANWDLGNFFYRQNNIDSSYYHYNLAYEEYLEARDEIKAGRMLLNMAILQEYIKDYVGSENTTFKALDLFEESTQAEKYIYRANNNLGIIYNGLENYPLALEYHRKALRNVEVLKQPVKSAQSLNNIGVVYQNMLDYQSSISNYNRALSVDSIYENNTRLYAMLTDNLGYSEFKLGNYQVAEYLFQEALQIRDSIGHKAGVVINKLHLGEYYLKSGDTTKAFQYTREANLLAEETTNNRDLLASYLLLAQIEPQKASNYLDNYIQLNDSLLKKERAIRNKFARIRFETDQYIQRTQELSNDKLWISLAAIILASVLFLLYLLKAQKVKNKELKYQKEQQEYNEEIYKLLLKQQTRLEEGRQEERSRISGELHDGVLGKLFGIRMNFGLLNLKTSNQVADKYDQLLEKLQVTEDEIRQISHNLICEVSASHLNFAKLLEQLIEEYRQLTSVEIKFNFDEDVEGELIDENIQINYYRILQEALQNVIKHAEASVVSIKIYRLQNLLLMEIRDDGKGFDIRKKVKGIGLKNMRNRMEKIDGTFSFETSGKGTYLLFKVKICKNG